MKRNVRIYIEGGSQGKIADSDFRHGWGKFLTELRELAQEKGFRTLQIVRGKSRSNTFERFKNYKKEFPNDLCVLLVDAETSVPDGADVWDIVANREGDKWQKPTWATERHLYLMVYMVEAWLLTDPDALQQFFKRDFNSKVLPKTNLESRPKAEIEDVLKRATQHSAKGAYRHGQSHEIIGIVKPDKVKTLRHGERLFKTLSALIVDESGK